MLALSNLGKHHVVEAETCGFLGKQQIVAKESTAAPKRLFMSWKKALHSTSMSLYCKLQRTSFVILWTTN